MTSGRATVKAVLSGDTLVLMGAATNGPPPELMLTLASLQAPRIARGPDGVNEPYGWASREFLRKLTIGKQVRFKVEYRVNAINRDFGSVWLPANARGVEENACVVVAREGWAKVKGLDQSRDGASPDLEKMLAVEQVAIAEKKGMYKETEDVAHTTIKWGAADGDDLLGTFKGKLVPAVIESVQNGSSMRAVLLPTMQIINFGLAGVQAPRTNAPGAGPGGAEGPQPHAREAKFFTESRLLHRDVELKLEGVDKYGNLYGGIVHSSGRNISAELLKHGLAKMADWSAAFLSDSIRSTLRAAEKEAKATQVKVWKDYQAPVLQSDRYFRGTVIEVISGDCVVVYNPAKNEEKRIYLSSLRAPRLGNARRNEPNAPYSVESKEFLRQKAIGKSVRVEVEYEKTNPAMGENALMTFASIFYESNNTKKKVAEAGAEAANAKGVNLAVELVGAGLAEVVRHRPDEAKSEYYDDLLTAESKSQTQKKGLHSGKEAPPEQRFTDLSTDANKAKQYLPFLKREKTTRAIVEYVYSGSRVKLFIPKENCMVNFFVAGIKCPQPTRYASAGVVSSPAEPFGEESKLFTKRSVMQRNVTVEIEDMDRGGNAFGVLYVGAKEEKNNFGCILLAEGLAWVDAFSAERTSTGAQLLRAEEGAKQAKNNYWKNYDAQAAAAKVNQGTQNATSDDVLPMVKLSEIVDGTTFFIQNVADRTCATVEEKMKEFTRTHGSQGKAFEVRRNGVCAGLFDDGNGPMWNRARIEYVNADGSVRVRLFDYGNVATLPATRVRPLDATLIQFPPQAKECVFGFIKPQPATAEFGVEAATLLGETAWGHTLTARIHGHDEQNRPKVSLYKNNRSVSEVLLEAGVIRTDRKSLVKAPAHQKAVVDGLLAAQTAAKKKRVAIWRYGDVESDED